MRTPFLSILVVLIAAVFARADAFTDAVNIDPLRFMSVQHNQTIKTFDTYARQTIQQITGRPWMGDMSASKAVLDVAMRPVEYVDRNVIYIRNKPFRKDIQQLPFLDKAEAERILHEGTISYSFWTRADVQDAMNRIMATSSVKATAINEINGQAGMLGQIMDAPHFRKTLMHQAIVPPEGAKHPNEKPWETLPSAATHLIEHPEGHDATYVESVFKMVGGVQQLSEGWQARDASVVNKGIEALAASAGAVNPQAYPSLTKRQFEVTYNSYAGLTWPGAFLYVVATVFFLVSFSAGVRWTYWAGWLFVIGGVLVHTAAIGIRWWLVEKSVGNWFESIPIKNQFESVMFAAWFGSIVALVLETGLVNRVMKSAAGWELRKLHGLGIFGAAGAAVGMLALLALYVTPFVTNNDIVGSGIRQNAGILMTYWLYIHVTLVTASYALIGMTFVIGVWYCVQYLANRDAGILQTLDAANLTMLQLAFWVLGVGIITGALWADVSWGRPWGWDPKETFALITWIVYLIIVHVRFVTAGTRRALTTSVLSVIGFFVMLFNWIGVNFFLVGLHSYA
jgi:ABC-type transport system involved in cytochrome c biogenesis permease subunit